MEKRTPWYNDTAVQEAVRQFILALIILGLALLGYKVEITQSAPAAPTPIVTEATQP